MIPVEVAALGAVLVFVAGLFIGVGMARKD